MLVTVASVLQMVIVMSALRIGEIRMKNKEKYAKEISELACNGNKIAIVRQTGELRPCCGISCRECLFRVGTARCEEKTREWAESEYIEKQVISKRDRAFLDFLIGKYEYIARDKTNYLYVYSAKPDKIDVFWSRNNGDCFCLADCADVDFPMIKWSDSEPWLIEDLKKLEVVENYE